MSTPFDRATDWLMGDDTGLSSKALCGHMLGKSCRAWVHEYPRDSGDMGRCLRLLALVPEWQPRVAEMAVHGPYWAALVARWDEIAASMAAGATPDTYALMRSILDPIRAKDKAYVDLGDGVSVRFS